MRKWTTPTDTIIVDDIDLTGCDVYATYSQGISSITKKVEPKAIEGGTELNVTFTQKETARFRPGPAKIQVNYVFPNGERDATKTAYVEVTENLLAKEVKYVG